MVERTVELGEQLPYGVVDPATAIQAGGDAPATWGELERLGQTFDRIGRLVRDLRIEGVLPSAGDQLNDRHLLRTVHRNPDVLLDAPDAASYRHHLTRPHALRLLAAIDGEARPELLTSDQIEERDRPAEPERTTTVWDGALVTANRPLSEEVKRLDDDDLAAEIATQQRILRETAKLANRSADERDASPEEKDARLRHKTAERRLPVLLDEAERRQANCAADIRDPAALAAKVPRSA